MDTYDLKNKDEVEQFLVDTDFMCAMNKVVQLKVVQEDVTKLQTRSIWRYLTLIANDLNEQGQTFSFMGFQKKMVEVQFNKDILHDRLWIPIQYNNYRTDSITKLKTNQLDKIIDSITLLTSEDYGFSIEFPNRQQLIDAYNENKKNNKLK